MIKAHYLRVGASTLTLAASLLGAPAAHAQSSASEFTRGVRFDAMRRTTGIIDPDPDGTGPRRYAAVRTTYDAAGRIVRVERGELTNWQDETVRPADWVGFTIASVLKTAYDDLDRKIRDAVSGPDTGSTTDKLLSVTSYSYDLAGRQECAVVRMNLDTALTTTAGACQLSQPASVAGAFGPDRISKEIYDAAGQLVQIRRAVGTPLEQGYATYGYSANGRISDVIDAKGNRSHMTYDGFDRLEKWQLPKTGAVTGFNDATPATSMATAGEANTADYEAYQYDPDGNRIGLRKRDGRQFTFNYDALGRMSSKIVPDGCAGGSVDRCPPSGATRDVFYGYDAQGRQTTARFDSPSGEGITNEYNGFGEMTSTASNLSGITRVVTHGFDMNGNQTSITAADRSWKLDFDGLDRPFKLWEGDGATLISTWTYGLDGKRQSVVERFGSGATYRYDAAGSVIEQSDSFAGSAGSSTVNLDRTPAGQIAERRRTNDAYAEGVRSTASSTYTVNGLNEYTSASGAALAYDANGNLSSMESITYGYDAENRLISVSGAQSALLSYDPLGRLARISGGDDSDTRFVYDGDRLVAEYDALGNKLRSYMHGLGDDEPLLWYEGGADARWLHSDHQGSITAVASSPAGTLLASNAYDEYGNPRSSNTGRFGFTGQTWLSGAALWYYKARVYSPKLGRFLQTDPVGYDDQVNLYSYVGNDPINRRDPSGMQCVAQGATTCAGAAVSTAEATAPATTGAEVVVVGKRILSGLTSATRGAAVALGDAAVAPVVAVGCLFFCESAAGVPDELEKIRPLFNKPPRDATDPNGAKAPGEPGAEEGFSHPKGGPKWGKAPNGKSGWVDSKGNVWVPTGPAGSPNAHGGPHWDVQKPGGGYTNVYPGGSTR